MDTQKLSFIGLLVLMPLTAALSVTTGLLYRDMDKTSQELESLKQTVIKIHGAPQQIALPKDSDGGSPAALPTIPTDAIPAASAMKKKSAKAGGKLGNDSIQLLESGNESNAPQKTQIMLSDD